MLQGVNAELWFEGILSDMAVDSDEQLKETLDIALSYMNATIAPQGYSRPKSAALQLPGKKINVKFMPIHQETNLNWNAATRIARIATPAGGVIRVRLNPTLTTNLNMCNVCFVNRQAGIPSCYCHARPPTEHKRAKRNQSDALRMLTNGM